MKHLNAEFCDIFGFLGFLILLYIGISLVEVGSKAFIIIFISVIGLVVDGYIVFTNFILKK